MQIYYRAPDGNCFLTEQDCLDYEASKPQGYWDRVNALQAFTEARKRPKERDEPKDDSGF